MGNVTCQNCQLPEEEKNAELIRQSLERFNSKPQQLTQFERN